jgi:hypothetical protein
MTREEDRDYEYSVLRALAVEGLKPRELARDLVRKKMSEDNHE